jgi:redox-sensitive bicupin YhaK (pirin superfamily)
MRPGRKAWLQIVRGAVDVHGQRLAAGDGAAVDGESALEITGQAADTELLLFDLP